LIIGGKRKASNNELEREKGKKVQRAAQQVGCQLGCNQSLIAWKKSRAGWRERMDHAVWCAFQRAQDFSYAMNILRANQCDAKPGNTNSDGHPCEEGVNFQRRLSDHTTILMAACRQGRLDLVQELVLQMGASVTLKDTQGRSAADFARDHDHANVVEWLADRECHKKKSAGESTGKDARNREAPPAPPLVVVTASNSFGVELAMATAAMATAANLARAGTHSGAPTVCPSELVSSWFAASQ
jgi:hypothetical protein